MTQELITQLHELSRKLRSNGDIEACILVEKAYDTIYRQHKKIEALDFDAFEFEKEMRDRCGLPIV